MNCREVVERVGEFHDGELPPAARLRIRWHLFICKKCRVYLETYKKTVAFARLVFGASSEGGGDAPVPGERVQAILRAVRAAP
ncbi:MAG: zf-HC2 domain-containing protein [Planctomycetes bacterium]|nr:zf-HC2 domain-containing protein [Planctomycetota bacterium]